MGFWSWLLKRNKTSKDGIGDSASAQSTVRANFGKEATGIARVQADGGKFSMDAVGESNYQPALEEICGGHSRSGHEFETDALIIREPQNPYDENAVMVAIDGKTVGYLTRQQAIRVGRQMDHDGIEKAVCRAKIVGGWRTNQHDEGCFGVRLAIPCRDWIDFGLGKRPTVRETELSREDKKIRHIAAQAGPLKGQYVVIWGASDYGSEAVELAALGAHIMAGVGKSTTLVVQSSDLLTPGMKASRIYKQAQGRVAAGASLEIVTLSALRKRVSISS